MTNSNVSKTNLKACNLRIFKIAREKCTKTILDYPGSSSADASSQGNPNHARKILG